MRSSMVHQYSQSYKAMMEPAQEHTLTLVICCRPLRVVDCERWKRRDATAHRRIHRLLTIEQLMMQDKLGSLSSICHY